MEGFVGNFREKSIKSSFAKTEKDLKSKKEWNQSFLL